MCLSAGMQLTKASSQGPLDQAIGKLHLLCGPAREVVGDHSHMSSNSLMNSYHRSHLVVEVTGKLLRILNF